MITKFEDYLNESKKEKTSINKWINDIDPHIKGTLDDKTKPMFVNLPDRNIRPSYDILRAGKYIDIDGITGMIIGVKNDMVLLDVIDKDTNKHEIKEYDVDYILKNIKKEKKNKK